MNHNDNWLLGSSRESSVFPAYRESFAFLTNQTVWILNFTRGCTIWNGSTKLQLALLIIYDVLGVLVSINVINSVSYH